MVWMNEVQQFLTALSKPFNNEAVAPAGHPFTCTTRHGYITDKFVAYCRDTIDTL